MQQMLKQAGIDMKIQSNETSTFFADIGKGNFQMYSLSRNGIQDPDFYYVILYSKNIPPEGQNRGYYQNPKLDALLLQGRSTFDRAKRKPAYEEVQKILADDLPYISLYLQNNVAVMRSNIDGYVQYPAGFWLSVPWMTMK
jgi:peptide/nickel transport system substrate-binding protein